jgi:hypothetical protein
MAIRFGKLNLYMSLFWPAVSRNRLNHNNSMAQCFNCGRRDIVESAIDCPTCNERIGFPNVRAADHAAEISALTRRFEEARERARARGADEKVLEFANTVAKSCAVINCDLYRLRELLSNGKSLYANYHQTVRAQVRMAAKEDFDRHRRAVDAMIFGEYADKIVFGALSIDGKGLASYGAYTILLREGVIVNRANVLEENSFLFIQRHELRPGDPIPFGYRASWRNKHLLAVAKLADAISSSTDRGEFAGLLLRSAIERAKDDFIEIHIYGTFDQHAIESVAGPANPATDLDKAIVAVLKEFLALLKKKWIEQ